MKLDMPLVTLLTGAALGAGVLVASMLSPATSSAATSPAGGYGAASSASAATTAAPSATATTPATTPAAASATTSAATGATTPAITGATATPAITGVTTPATAPATAAATAPVAPVSANQASANQASVPPPKADYVGRVDSGGAAVAISVHGDKAVAYICNGHAVAAWFRGRAVAGKLDLTGKNGARLRVDYRKAETAGSIVADGTRYTFSAPKVRAVSTGHRPPGLYEATATVHGVSIKAGWIVLPDGSQVGSVEYDPGSPVPPTAQAPVLDLATGTSSYAGVTLVASLITGITGSGF